MSKAPSRPVDRVMARELRGGEFKRQDSHFREWVGVDANTGKRGLPVSAGRYHLYVSLACPWCHRTAIVRELAGLILDKQVRIGRPTRIKGLAEATHGPAFSTAAGLLLFAMSERAESPRPSRSAPSGMFGRVGQWLRENF